MLPLDSASMKTSGWLPTSRMPRLGVACILCCITVLLQAKGQHIQAVRQFLEGSPADAKEAETVQIRGVVTALWGDRAFFVQDDTGGLFAFRNDEDSGLKPHDSVLLTGRAVKGGSTPHLKVSAIQVLGRGSVPSALELSPETPLSPAFDARLVRFRGKVASAPTASQGLDILVEAFGIPIPVEYPGKPEPTRWPAINADDLVSVTGVLSARGPGDTSPHPFRVIVASRNDVSFVSSPPRWKRVRVPEVALAGILLAAAIFGWGMLLRRQVRRQTNEIRNRFEHEAALERRYRDLVENATDVILTHEFDGRITSINPAATELHGMRTDRVVDMPVE